MLTQLRAVSLVLSSLMVLPACSGAETPGSAPQAMVNPQLLAKAVPPVATNTVNTLAEAARNSLAEKFTEKDLLFFLAARLQPKQETGELELELIKLMPPWKPVPVTAGPIDLRILDKPNSGLSTQFSLRFEVVSGEKSLGVYFANVKARLFKDVWTAPSALKRGTALDEADLRKDRRDVINLRDPVWTSENLAPTLRLSDFRLAESIPAGAVVFVRHVQLRPIMFRGQQVQAVIKDDVMSVSAKVEILEDGAPGQLVKARNLRTKKEIRGKVLNEETIQVLY